ncbi:hypothetical protein BVY03_00615, partial [bacterium K02(2017)]
VRLSYLLGYYLRSPYQFYHNAICDEKTGFDYSLKDMIKYPYISPDMGHFKKEYGIDTLVISKKSLNIYKNMDVSFDLDERKKVYEDEGYLVYDI